MAEPKNKRMEFAIDGMSCAACSAACERALKRVEGVVSASVNLASGRAAVIYEPEAVQPPRLFEAVRRAGYEPREAPDVFDEAHEKRRDEEFVRVRRRLVVALVFGAAVFYIGMAHMFGLPLPRVLNPMMSRFGAALDLLLTLPVLIAGRDFYKKGVPALLRGNPNMDSLVALGTASAFLYSLYGTARFFVTGMAASGLYYESATTVVALVMLGKYLEARSRRAAGDALRSLAELLPRKARVERDGQTVEVPAEELMPGDIVAVAAGGTIPVDGVVLTGEASVDESMLTGESTPVFKGPGSTVSGGSVDYDSLLRIVAKGVGGDTAAARIAHVVLEAQARKAPVARLADVISGWFVPAVGGVAFVAGLIWLLAGRGLPFALNIFVSVLVVACPCALGLATPIAVMAASGRGAKLGVLYRGGDMLEAAARVDTVVLDKTGTLTEGRLQVKRLVALPEFEAPGALPALAAVAENGSDHPAALAIVKYAAGQGSCPMKPESSKALPGRGLTAVVGGKTVLAGSLRLMEENGVVFPRGFGPEEGETAVYFAVDRVPAGLAALADTLRPDAADAVARLHKLGIRTVMLTGDNAAAAKSIAVAAHIDEMEANILPEGKQARVEALRKTGRRVAMVGDGINDAPALTAADVGVAIGAGTDVAVQSAGVVLMSHRLSAMADLFELSRRAMRIVRENLFWAFAYNIVGLPLAAGVFYAFGGPLLSPAFAGAAMSMSSVIVVTNALRLRGFRGKPAQGPKHQAD